MAAMDTLPAMARHLLADNNIHGDQAYVRPFQAPPCPK